MNRKKFFLSVIIIYALGNTFQIKTMDAQQTVNKKDTATQLLLEQFLNLKPNPKYMLQLIQQGADLNARNAMGANILHAAAIRNNLQLAKLLITHGADIDITENDGNTPLHFACEEGSMEVIKLLCEHGANINSTNNIGESPLHRACEFGHLNIVEFLVHKGALVNAITKELVTPLHSACTKNFFKIVDFLIKNKADINAKNYKGTTPLHFACLTKNTETIITLLIKSGADINAITKETRWTPLHCATIKNNAQACTVLLKNGADTSLTTSDGMTALDIAYDLGHKNIISLLESYNRQTNAQADAQMRAFFAELNQEAAKKKKKPAKKKKKPRPQPTVEINPEATYHNRPEASSLETTEDALLINQLLEEQLIEEQRIEKTIPATEIVIETPSTTTPVVQPTAPAPIQRPTKIVQQKSIHPDVAPAPRNNGYLILIGQNLKWPQLNKNQQQLIKNNLLSLKNWPDHNLDIKQLKGEVNLYRLRVGNYRIIFAVDTVRREIKVQKIGLRKEIYKQYKS